MQLRGFEFQQAAFNTTEWHKGSCQEVKDWWQAEGPVPQSMPNPATGCRLVDLSLLEKEAGALFYEQDLCIPCIHKHIQKMQVFPDCWIQNPFPKYQVSCITDITNEASDFSRKVSSLLMPPSQRQWQLTLKILITLRIAPKKSFSTLLPWDTNFLWKISEPCYSAWLSLYYNLGFCTCQKLQKYPLSPTSTCEGMDLIQFLPKAEDSKVSFSFLAFYRK